VDEVVDVPAIELGSGGGDKVRECVEEAAWALDLPGTFDASFAVHVVSIER
jgi:hypothetical protein